MNHSWKFVTWCTSPIYFWFYWLCHWESQTNISQSISFSEIRLRKKFAAKNKTQKKVCLKNWGKINLKAYFVAIKNSEIFWRISTENMFWRKCLSISLSMCPRNKTHFLFCGFQSLLCLDYFAQCFCDCNNRFGNFFYLYWLGQNYLCRLKNILWLFGHY